MQTRSDDLNNAGSLQRRSQSVICQIVEPAAAAEGTEQATNRTHRPRAHVPALFTPAFTASSYNLVANGMAVRVCTYLRG